MVRKYIEDIQKFCLMDDIFMTQVFEHRKDLVQFVLRIILNKDDLEVKTSATQKERKSIGGHSVKFDVYAVDSTGKEYDIEIQRSNDGAIPQRARYNSAMLDSSILPVGEPYRSLKDSYVIFITENDILNSGLPIYTIKRVIDETGELFEDGSHIIYVNGSYKGTDEIGKLMHDFHCTTPKDMNYEPLASGVSYFKSEKGGQTTMCGVMEELLKETAEEVAKETSQESAKKMLLDNLPIEKVAEYSGLSLEEVIALKENI